MINKNQGFVPIIAFYLPLLFITPLLMAVQNYDDIVFAVYLLTITLLLLTVSTILATYFILKLFSENTRYIIVCLLLAMATVLVVQGYFVHDFFDYGQFDGTQVQWRDYGIIFWLEIFVWLVAVPLLAGVYFKKNNKLNTIAWVLIIITVVQPVMVVDKFLQTRKIATVNTEFDQTVFEFSAEKNLIHLLPDGFQGDIVKQVLLENPKLAESFEGFTLFEDHMGMFQGTSPTVRTMLTGEAFDLNAGYYPKQEAEKVAKQSYVNHLAKAGFGIDQVTISSLQCSSHASTCIKRPFNDLKSRGYYQHKSLLGDISLLFDLSMFRHGPMYFKEKIYNQGQWLFSAKFSGGQSPFPDPVIREWIENMQVVLGKPRYKWYHFIGTHIPAQWDEGCSFIGRQEQAREPYKDQTYCILGGIARFLDKLKQMDIYDKTAIVITGDHGSGIAANDITGESSSQYIFNNILIGSARPLFMVKEIEGRQALKFSNTATSIIDIAPTVLAVVGLKDNEYRGQSAYTKKTTSSVIRSYKRYDAKSYWSGNPISFTEYQVIGKVNNRANWHLVDLHNRPDAPTNYNRLGYDNAFDFSLGLLLSKKQGKEQKHADIRGKEFVILLSKPEHLFDKLVLKLKVPDFSTDQSLTVSVNGKKIIKDFKLNNVTNAFFVQEVPFPAEVMQEGNNTFRFEFSKAGLYKKGNFTLSAVIESISLQ